MTNVGRPWWGQNRFVVGKRRAWITRPGTNLRYAWSTEPPNVRWADLDDNKGDQVTTTAWKQADHPIKARVSLEGSFYHGATARSHRLGYLGCQTIATPDSGSSPPRAFGGITVRTIVKRMDPGEHSCSTAPSASMMCPKQIGVTRALYAWPARPNRAWFTSGTRGSLLADVGSVTSRLPQYN